MRARDAANRPGRLPGERGSFAWWFHALGEIAVLYALIVVVELSTGDGRIGGQGAHPHPYWLVVIPVACARGMVAGLVAAAAASTLHVLGGLETRSAAEFERLLTFSGMLEPILFFGVGFFVGESRDLIADRARRLRYELTESQGRARRIRSQREVLTEANRALEKRLVDGPTEFATLIEVAGRLESADRTELANIALELVEEHCGGSASVLLLLSQGALEHFCHRGWQESEVPRRLEDARESPIVARALVEGRSVSGFALDRPPPESGPLAVTPLVGRGGVIEALLCLDEIPPSRLNESTVRTFFATGRWISAALAHLPQRIEEPRPTPGIRAKRSADWLGTDADLGARLYLEYARCVRFGVPFSLLTIQFTDLIDGSPEFLSRVDEFVGRTFAPRLRSSDGVFQFPHPGCYVVLLAGTPLEGGEVVLRRLSGRVEGREVPDLGAIAFHATGPNPEAPDVANLLDCLVRRFRDEGALPLGRDCPLVLPVRPRVGSLEDGVRRITAELNLATRNDTPLQVVGLIGRMPAGADPGLLAFHVQQTASRNLRTTDGAYSVGPNHVALVLPHTERDEAERAVRRLDAALSEHHPDAPYQRLTYRILGFGPRYHYLAAFLQGLAAARPLQDVEPAGGRP